MQSSEKYCIILISLSLLFCFIITYYELDFLILVYVFAFFPPAFLPGTLGGQKKASDALEWELQMVVSPKWVLGAEATSLKQQPVLLTVEQSI